MRIACSLLSLTAMAVLPAAARAQSSAALTRVDSIFQRWNSKETPGCAVAGARSGQPFFSRAYGMADLEHDVSNTPTTVFEAGSVSKQFTAAAIVLLAQEGKLSLNDDIRKYLPEVPDYGTPITIRHMMTHTSGFRDWGSVAGIAGWPRTSRVHTHAHVLDIVSRQRALNFKPGEQYNYSNTNFNLQVIIVDRVSGMPFAEFTKKRLFEPLGMTSTSWRDDYTRIVKGRSVAYSAEQTGFSTDMPFENVHGNGGLLTTVGDLLIWTENLETGKLGGPAFVEMMHRRGVLNNGDTITYASGLMVGRYNNTPEVSHTGSTAGYRAFLARYPQQKLSFALLCNIGSVNPGGVGHQVADIFLGNAATPVAGGGQRTGRGGGAGQRGAAAGAYTPTTAELASYAGEYYSPDAETTLTVVVEGNQVIVRRRPATRVELRPTAQDQFSGQGGLGTVRFIRDASGRVTQLSVRQDRVFDLRFDRVTR